jgi:apolipoprotein N-acyltransferase
MRSAELGVDVIHGSVTGRSTFITNGGVVGETTGLAEITSLAGTVQFRTGGLTLYARLGDWVSLIGIVWLVDGWVRTLIRRNGRNEQDPRAASGR